MARTSVLGKRSMNSSRRILTRSAVKQLASTPLTVCDLNVRINNMYCKRTEAQLSDLKLMKKYINAPSVQRKIGTLQQHLLAIDVPESTVSKIVNNQNVLRDFCVQPGTKGAIRGYQFNMIIKRRLEQIYKYLPNKKDYTLVFEQKYQKALTSEIPDWYILQKSTGRVIIGMNQIDLWSGGQQTNRGAKYILNETFHSNTNVKFLSVVCNHVQLENDSSKTYQLLLRGIQCNRLVYINGLRNLIYDYFGI